MEIYRDRGAFLEASYLLTRPLLYSHPETIRCHLRKVRGEQEDVFEWHKYDLTMDDLEKLVEDCKHKGIEMRVMPFSQYWPNHTIVVRFVQKKRYPNRPNNHANSQ